MISIVLFMALLGGGTFAFDDYFRQFNSFPSNMRNASENVRRDTKSAIVRRFAFGSDWGAFVGLAIVIGGAKRKGKDDGHA
jgi:hypothetical protein